MHDGQTEEEQVEELYDQGLDGHEIAEETGIDYHEVMEILAADIPY